MVLENFLVMKKFLKILSFCCCAGILFFILYTVILSLKENEEVIITISKEQKNKKPILLNKSNDKNSNNVNINSNTAYSIDNKSLSHEEKLEKIFNNVMHNKIKKTGNDLSIIICEVGFSTALLKDFIKDFDKNITIGINAAQKDRDYLKDYALKCKHEVFFLLPFEPIEFPDNNPGPLTILTGVTSDENIYKMNLLLGGGDGVTGIINTIGSRFVISPQDMMHIMKFCQRKDLIYVNAVNYENEIVNEILRSSGAKYIMVNSLFDVNYATEENILDELESVLIKLKQEGHAITIMFATQNVYNVLKTWLEKHKDVINLIKVSEYFNNYCN